MARNPKYAEPMKTVTVRLREADVEWLDERAKERDADRSAILRLVLDRFRVVSKPARSEVTPRPKK